MSKKPNGRKRWAKRYFMSRVHMREAKWIREMLNSKVNRGELKDFSLFQCGCGCGVAWSEE